MLKQECVRCHGTFPEDEGFYLGIGNGEEEGGFSCEGCLSPCEQDYYFAQHFPIVSRWSIISGKPLIPLWKTDFPSGFYPIPSGTGRGCGLEFC